MLQYLSAWYSCYESVDSSQSVFITTDSLFMQLNRSQESSGLYIVIKLQTVPQKNHAQPSSNKRGLFLNTGLLCSQISQQPRGSHRPPAAPWCLPVNRPQVQHDSHSTAAYIQSIYTLFSSFAKLCPVQCEN